MFQRLLIAAAAAAMIVLLIVSCTPYSHKLADVGYGVKTLSLDGSKRAIIAFERNDHHNYFCAEPSPDAMGTLALALASKFTAKGDITSANLDVNATTAVVSLFSRSQGIQALRDGLYRMCEAFANGAIDEETYEKHSRALIATLNFVVPVEICSGVSNATSGESTYTTIDSNSTITDFQQCVAEARFVATLLYVAERLGDEDVKTLFENQPEANGSKDAKDSGPTNSVLDILQQGPTNQ